MKKFLFLIVLSTPSFANEVYNATNIEAEEANIKWVRVQGDINTFCQNAATKLNLPKFKTKLRACSFWQDVGWGLFNSKKRTCTVYTPANIDLAVLGHESFHCFNGHFHD